MGPNCSFYSGRHPTDPRVRNGTNGPEDGAPIVVGEDCWLGGNVIVLPGVTIAGNPARVLKPVRPAPAETLPPGYVPPADIPISEAGL
ncbi:hypothetical protein GGS20DRAFT_446783 [Poronia punctata]|nr:hypothetical protein GGS20DRAFT_446783 [Poronia punctata]